MLNASLVLTTTVKTHPNHAKYRFTLTSLLSYPILSYFILSYPQPFLPFHLILYYPLNLAFYLKDPIPFL